MSSLYTRHNYIADIDMIKNVPIVEYDMKEAGYNLLQWKGYFSNEQLEKLKYMTKQDRSIEIGKMQLKDKSMSKFLMQCFIEARQMFFEANDLQDHEVVSIKKDAILSLKKCNITKLNEYIEFRPKNEYIGYIKLMGNKEFYYKNRCDTFDIKGFSDEVVEHHNKYLFKDLHNIFSKIINGYDSYIDDLIYLKYDFCAFNLSKEYYKDVIMGKYVIKTYVNNLMGIDDIDDDMRSSCFNNNNLNFILNMLKVLT